jgi:hypothetical protein
MLLTQLKPRSELRDLTLLRRENGAPIEKLPAIKAVKWRLG